MATAKRTANSNNSSSIGAIEDRSEAEQRSSKFKAKPKKSGRHLVAAGTSRHKQRAREKTVSAAKASINPLRGTRESRAADHPFRSGSKGAAIVGLLKREGGATITELSEATGWQAHSVRGFLSGSLQKKPGMAVASEIGDGGERRYRIAS